MRKHGISGFPDPSTSPPSNPAGNSAIIGSGGYYLAIPKSIDTSSPAFEQAAAACNFGPEAMSAPEHPTASAPARPPQPFLSVALALAGCGGSSSSGVAHLSSGKGASSASSESGGASPESPASLEQAGVAYAKCMRANGVPNFPDPNAGGGFLFHARAGMNPSSPVFKAAQAKCQQAPARRWPRLGAPTLPADAGEVSEDRAVHAPARRLRLPRPSDLGPIQPVRLRRRGVISDIEGVILLFPSTIDQQSPVFTRAAAACAFPLHNH